MNFVYGALGLAALIASALWYISHERTEAAVAAQAQCQLAVVDALDVERKASKKKADALAAEIASTQANLQAQIRGLRDIKDPTKCYAVNLNDDLLKRLRDDYAGFSH